MEKLKIYSWIQVASKLNLSRNAFVHLVKVGKLPKGVVQWGRMLLYTEDQLKEMKTQKTDSGLIGKVDTKKALGVARRTLDLYVAQSHIVPVKVGERDMFRSTDVEALKAKKASLFSVQQAGRALGIPPGSMSHYCCGKIQKPSYRFGSLLYYTKEDLEEIKKSLRGYYEGRLLRSENLSKYAQTIRGILDDDKDRTTDEAR